MCFQHDNEWRQRKKAGATAVAGGEGCGENDETCANPDVEEPEDFGGCVPVYRTALTYIYYISGDAWYQTGHICIGKYVATPVRA